MVAAEKVGLNPNDMQRVALGNLSGALTALENQRRRCHEHSRHPVPDARRRKQVPRHHGPERAAGAAARGRHRHRRSHEEKSRQSCARSWPPGAKAVKFIERAHGRRQQDSRDHLRAAAAQGRRHDDAAARRGEILQRGPDRDAASGDHRARHEISSACSTRMSISPRWWIRPSCRATCKNERLADAARNPCAARRR